MIASDHAPHGCIDKQTEFELAANGILGLQTTVPLMLGLVHQGKMSLSRMVEALSVSPAKLFSHNSALSVGSDADITILDLSKKWKLTPDLLASKSANSPFLGREFIGSVFATFVGGEVK